MVIRTRRKKKGGRGFTLLEMLLAVALLIALLAAVVFNFGSLRRGADLEEGSRQLEALVRFAAAHAANSGRSVQFRFAGESASTNMVDVLDDIEDTSPKLRVVWEPDPALQPGVYVDLPQALQYVEAIQDRVRIETVRTPQPLLNLGTNEIAAVQEGPAPIPSVTFFPDGSSETADIVLLARDREDIRQMTVHIDGVTGSVRSELSTPEELVGVEWMEDQNSAERKTPSAAATVTEPVIAEDRSVQPIEEPEPLIKNPTQTTNDFDADFPK